LAIRQLLEVDGLTAYAKTSGNKGAQLYVPVEPTSPEHTSGYARQTAQRLEEALPELVVAAMDKKLRSGKVFIDWSQNNGAKTTIAPYSLRGRAEPTVSTPLTWEEVAGASDAADLVFTTVDVLDRVDTHGDLLADMPAAAARLP
jgi:bifunctional non-homologous end joining protein LigD